VGCFSECDNLLTVSIYGAVEEYPTDCFKNCPKLTKTGGTSTAFASLKRIGDGAYENCVSLNSTTAGTWYLSRYTALESIGANAFKGCTSLTRDVEFSSTLNYIGADAFAGCSNLPEIILHSAEPPAFGTIGLAGLPSDFRILVPDSLESEDSIYLAYLEVLSEELGEEQAVAVLDSVSDGARARYLLKLEEEKKKKAEEKHTVEKMPAVETPEDGTPEESAEEEASEEETSEKETTDEGISDENVQAASVPEDPENSVDASREETLQETSDQSEAEDTQTDPEENGSSE
jgi:hypothetical protein